jgi:hypothetical protein
MIYIIEMASCYTPGFMEIVEGILWFYPSNLKGCSIGITDGREL